MDKELYQKGYDHGMISNVLTDFRESYRMGFREAKLYCKKHHNTTMLPRKFKIKVIK